MSILILRNDAKHEIEESSFQIILPIESILDENYHINSDGVLEFKKTFGSNFLSKKFIKKIILGLIYI